MKFLRSGKFYQKMSGIKNNDIGAELYIFIKRRSDNILTVLCWMFRKNEWRRYAIKFNET
jgi:hypothetical protein